MAHRGRIRNQNARATARSTPAPDPEVEHVDFYDHPRWYDMVHTQGTLSDVKLLERLNRKHGTGGDRWLEPACGTGRYLAVLARRGYHVTGYDLNDHALMYARGRLRKYGSHTPVLRGEMTSFVRVGRFDLVFNLINTFRHLLRESEAAAHLRCIARSLRPRGIYVLGLDVLDYCRPEPVEDVWKARRGWTSAQHVMMAVPPERQSPARLSGKAHEVGRRERIINFLTISTPRRGSRILESTYDLRTYDLRELLSTIRRSPFEIVTSYRPDGTPIALDERTRDVVLVLKAR